MRTSISSGLGLAWLDGRRKGQVARWEIALLGKGVNTWIWRCVLSGLIYLPSFFIS